MYPRSRGHSITSIIFVAVILPPFFFPHPLADNLNWDVLKRQIIQFAFKYHRTTVWDGSAKISYRDFRVVQRSIQAPSIRRDLKAALHDREYQFLERNTNGVLFRKVVMRSCRSLEAVSFRRPFIEPAVETFCFEPSWGLIPLFFPSRLPVNERQCPYRFRIVLVLGVFQNSLAPKARIIE